MFDETVRAGTLNVTQIILQDTASNFSNSSYRLTDSEGSLDDSTVIIVSLSFFDLNQIKKLRNLASRVAIDPSSGSGSASGSGSGVLEPVITEHNTFIVLSPEAIEDMNFSPVVEISSSQAKEVRSITLDTSQPRLVSFDFNLNSEQVILTFSETVDVMTLSLLDFAFLGDPDPPTANYTLTGGTSPSEDDYIIVVQLDIDDVNNIKRDRNLAVSNESMLIYLSPVAILDMNRNPLNFTQPLQVRVFTVDTTPPVLVSFDLELNTNVLTLVFNETVSISSLMVTEISVQDSVSVNESDYNAVRFLEGGIPLSLIDSTIVEISLDSSDTNYIKRFINLATSPENTYLSLSNQTVLDTNDNMVTAILASNAVLVRNFTEDSTSPFLLSYELDLTDEEIRFVFDETVNINSFDVSQLSLIGVDNTSYALTGGEINATQNDTAFTLVLTTFDLNEIKKIEQLATSANNTFAQFNASLLVDMNANYVEPGDGIALSMFIEDSVDPVLMSYHLDMNFGLLHLTFSETVRASSLIPLYPYRTHLM